jgi:hypothetical protein
LFIPCDIKPNNYAIYKIVKKADVKELNLGKARQQNSTLSIVGFSQDGEALFEYNKGEISQKFGVSLRYYLA